MSEEEFKAALREAFEAGGTYEADMHWRSTGEDFEAWYARVHPDGGSVQ
jgi:hypothetical protein